MIIFEEEPLDNIIIEIIAIGKEKVHSVGSIVVEESGDIYYNYNNGDSDFHFSRHASGFTHWKSKEIPILCQELLKEQPTKKFKGIEGLPMIGINNSDSLPELYKECKIVKNDGVFCIDMRQYKDGTFNMFPYIFTKEGLPSILSEKKDLVNRQISIFPECHPMIAIIVGGTRIETDNQHEEKA